MNIVKWTIGVALIAMSTSQAMAQTAIQTAFNCGCGEEPSCGCEEPSCCCEEPSCGCEEPSCCCEEPSCGCEDPCCCDACGCGSSCSLFGDCCLGEPFSLSSEICGCNPLFDMGGWTQIGYHNNATPLSLNRADAFSFNDVPGDVNLHQQWMWFERVADGSCGLDWGFRFDVMYGTDAQKTQAFGNPDPPGRWDTSLDHGVYGWAMPQAYIELASGDFSVIAGHFYTLIGYEVVTAPDNFFYSHALTMFNSEPFTHTGVLGTYSGLEDVTLYGGWTLGWDTGFDQFNGGSSFLGGFSADLTDDVAFTYICTAGDFGGRARFDGNINNPAIGAGKAGYSHSLVFDVSVSDNLNYVFQSDLVAIDAQGGQVVANDQVGINQYLFYTLNDCAAVGGRFEWWKSDGFDFYEATMGLNYRPHANIVVRPEVRFDWAGDAAAAVAAGAANKGAYDRTTFGIDAILTY